MLCSNFISDHIVLSTDDEIVVAEADHGCQSERPPQYGAQPWL